MKYINRHLEQCVTERSRSHSADRAAAVWQDYHAENGREYVTLDDLTARDMAKNDPALFCSFTSLRC